MFELIFAKENLNSLDYFIYGLILGVILIVLSVTFILFIYRNKKLKSHKIYINMDGGSYQNSTSDLVLTCKAGMEVDLRNIKPTKLGYNFNGFNIYKRYLSSSISSLGIKQEEIIKEVFDGADKSIIIMPDCDLYLVAKYSTIYNSFINRLVKLDYYPDFLNIADLISEITHLNYNEKFSKKIHIYFTKEDKNFYFVFKDKTLFMIIQLYKGINKVYFRLTNKLDELLLTSTFQLEDINDTYYWYSYIVSYNSKVDRFINLTSKAYLEIDDEVTSETEFDLILSSLDNLSDPLLDRSILLLKTYEKDKNSDVVPDYVKYRDNPTLLNKVDKKEEKIENLTLDEKEEMSITKSSLMLNKKDIINLTKERYKDVHIKNEEKSLTSIYQNNTCKIILLQNRFGLVKIIAKLNDKEKIENKFSNLIVSKFPSNRKYYLFYLDERFKSLDDLYFLLDGVLN